MRASSSGSVFGRPNIVDNWWTTSFAVVCQPPPLKTPPPSRFSPSTSNQNGSWWWGCCGQPFGARVRFAPTGASAHVRQRQNEWDRPDHPSENPTTARGGPAASAASGHQPPYRTQVLPRGANLPDEPPEKP